MRCTNVRAISRFGKPERYEQGNGEHDENLIIIDICIYLSMQKWSRKQRQPFIFRTSHNKWSRALQIIEDGLDTGVVFVITFATRK
jgi:hypothetical protein